MHSDQELRDEEPPSGGFFRFTVGRPVALLVAFITLLVVGAIAYQRTPLMLMPDGFSEPRLNIWIPNQGSTAQENEEKVARVIEEELRTLNGIEEVESRSEEGLVRMWVRFDPTLDLDVAKAEVRDRIERARPRLPATVQEIASWSEDAGNLPVSFFGVTHPGDSDRTDFLIEKIVKPRIEAVEGISNVDIWGVLQDSVRILLDEDKVRAVNLDVGRLIGRLSRDNFAMPLGDMDDGGTWTILRADMRFRSLEEIAAYPIGEGLVIADVGQVRKVKSVRDSLSRIDGQYAYVGMATKESAANVVETSRNFRRALQEIERDPAVRGELGFVEFFVQGDLIENSLEQLRSTALWGGALAVVVLFAFLRRVRLTICVALSIPVAALMAIAVEYFTGGSFNVLTMTGVTLAIGMLVDNSVVVVENIARVRQGGSSSRESASRGAREIALAVTLATLTSVVVFLPLIFMSENPLIRVIFGGIGLPLCTSLLFSLLVALVFLPVITARLLGGRPRAVAWVGGRLAPLLALPAVALGCLVAGLRLIWHLGLRAAWRVERLVLALLPLPVRLVCAAGLGWLAYWIWSETRPAAELARELGGPGEGSASTALAIAVSLPALLAGALLLLGVPRWRRRPGLPPARPAHLRPSPGSVLDMVIDMNRALVAWTLRHRLGAAGIALLAFLSIQIPMRLVDVAAFMTGDEEQGVGFGVRFDAQFTLAEASREMAFYEEFIEGLREEWGFNHLRTRFDDDSGRVDISWDHMITSELRGQRLAELQAALPRRPGHRLRFYDEDARDDRNRNLIEFAVQGPDWAELERLGAEALALLGDIDGLGDLSSPLDNAPEMLEVEIDRDLALGLGVGTDNAQQSISWALRGFVLSRYHEEGLQVPFLIEFDEDEIAGLGTLRDLEVYTETNQVPLSSFASIRTTKASNRIWRENGRSTFRIRARLDSPSQRQEVEAAGYAALAQLELPRGFSLGVQDGSRQRQEEEFAELQNALILSIFLVFLLMAILFESLLLPFSVLCTIPFALLGAMWTILFTGIPMDFMGWIGMIILSGVVVNNGIVLIHRIHQLVLAGTPRDRAIVQGCAQRVRPILMTALTTVFGLLPMALSEPLSDSVPYRALAAIVAGGLLTSTFFTLWVVPLAYSVFDDLSITLRARLGWALRRGGTRAGGVELVEG